MEIINKVFKQTSWQLIGKAITTISTLFILGIITRSYGAEGTGIYTLATSFLAFFFIAADLGLNNYIIQKINNSYEEINNLINFRFYWSLLLVLVSNLTALFLPFRSYEFSIAVLIGSLIIVSTSLLLSINLIFQHKLKYEKLILATSAGSLVMIPIVLLFVSLNINVSLIITANLIGSFISLFIALLVANKDVFVKIQKIDIQYPLKIFQEVWPLSLTLLINLLYFRIDSFLITHFKGFADVGIYNLAYSVFQNALVLPTFIMNGYYPLMLQSIKTDFNMFKNQLKIALGIMLGLSILGTVSTLLISDFLINILGGVAFQGSSISLKILSLSFPAYFLSSVFMWVFMSYKKYLPMLFIYLLGILFNGVLNYIFIPKFSYIASAWITGISEYLILIMQVFILYKYLKLKEINK